ncbi:MAG: hypothetical protein JW704_12775 [Anaerolineaceae bacterium]|nr:hypothetical protein [Anaerolineaceae bacterium]
MRLSDYRQYEPKAGIKRQASLERLFLYLTGCNITGVNNSLPPAPLLQVIPLEAEEPAARSSSIYPTQRGHRA